VAEALRLCGQALPVGSIGSDALLRLFKVAVFCSRRCPPERMIAALDWARTLPEKGTALVGVNEGRMLLLADEVFIIHADGGSHTERLGRYARERGKRVVAPA